MFNSQHTLEDLETTVPLVRHLIESLPEKEKVNLRAYYKARVEEFKPKEVGK